MKTQNSKIKTQNFLKIFLLVFVLFIFTLVKPLSAQQTLPLLVYPARHQLEVSPGEKTAVTVNFVNQSNISLSGFFRITDFIVTDNQGTPELIESPEAADPRFSASSWFSAFYDRGTIPANEKVSYLTQIQVPKDAAPGGRYVAIYFEPNPNFNQPQTGGEKATAISPRLASLISIKVKGPIKESALITQFTANKFQEYGPIIVKTEILNQGDYHITPKGKIVLTDYFGKIIDQQKLAELNIFPNRSRIFENRLGKKWLIGRYRLDLTATYGEKNQVLTAALYIWILPYRVILVISLTIIIIILLLRHFYQKSVIREKQLETLLEEEKEEIEKLKEELKKRKE